MNLMQNFAKEYGIEINLPLGSEIIKGHENRGYGSELDDYTYTTIEYFDPNSGQVLFSKFSDNHPHEEVKWWANEKFEPMWSFFGDEAFITFVKHFFKLDLSDKGTKRYDWVFR